MSRKKLLFLIPILSLGMLVNCGRTTSGGVDMDDEEYVSGERHGVCVRSFGFRESRVRDGVGYFDIYSDISRSHGDYTGGPVFTVQRTISSF